MNEKALLSILLQVEHMVEAQQDDFIVYQNNEFTQDILLMDLKEI